MLAALPFDLAVQLFDEPEFTHRRRAFECLPVGEAVPLLEAMSTDQLADLLREIKEPERGRLLAALKPDHPRGPHPPPRLSPHRAGGIMTTEFVSVGADWTVGRTLAHIREVARDPETVYAIYVLDPRRAGWSTWCRCATC